MIGVFTWLNKQGVRSTSGFEVQTIDRFTVRYREGLRFVDVYVEPGISAGKLCLSIEDAAFEKWGNSSVDNTLEEQQRIRKNFCDAMDFQGIVVV
jgi:hypothetical protein